VLSSLLRATIFFFTNMVAGWHAALGAMATGRRHRRIGSCGVMRVWVEYIGSLAAACTTLCWVPQALKIIREKQTHGISLITQAVFTVGLALWLVYGILLTNWPLMISNAVTLVFAFLILILKVRYR
jgi:MtN3 and saliva related transmembrane protein